jgi:hypothetical protein
MEGLELYTKSEVALQYPLLREYLYRKENAEVYHLMRYLKILLEKIRTYKTESVDGKTIFIEFNKKIDLVQEKYTE